MIHLAVFHTSLALLLLYKFIRTGNDVILFGVVMLGFVAYCKWVEVFQEKQRARRNGEGLQR